MQGMDINGRKITVEVSKRNKPREPTPGKVYDMKEDVQVRRELHLQEGRGIIVSPTQGLDLQAGLTEDIGTADIIMRRGDTDTIDPDQDQARTEGTGTETAIQDHLADDMYTSPTQLNIQLPTVSSRIPQNNDIIITINQTFQIIIDNV